MTRTLWIAAVLLVVLLAAGCNADKQYTWDYGRAYHTVFENQKLNPDAGDGTPVTEQSGLVAEKAYERYIKSEEVKIQENKPPVLLNIKQ